jgi:hypothetical protein
MLTRSRVRLLGALTALCVSSACTLNTDVTSPGAVIKYSGDDQTAAVNTVLPSPLAVIVVDQFGQRLKNVTVNWTIESGGGSLSASTVLTDDSGISSVTYTTGSTAGVVVIRAQVHGVPPLTFHVTVT